MLERIPISTHWETTSGSKSKLTWLPQEPYSIWNAIYIYIHILTNESPLFSKQYILNPRVPELSEHTHKYTHMCNSCCLPPVLDHSQLITHIFSSTLCHLILSVLFLCSSSETSSPYIMSPLSGQKCENMCSVRPQLCWYQQESGSHSKILLFLSVCVVDVASFCMIVESISWNLPKDC